MHITEAAAGVAPDLLQYVFASRLCLRFQGLEQRNSFVRLEHIRIYL